MKPLTNPAPTKEVLRYKPTWEEMGFLSIIRLNRLMKKAEIRREWLFGGFKIVFNWRSPKNPWGRFGGGWQYKLGFEYSGGCLLLNLLTFTLLISKVRKEGVR